MLQIELGMPAVLHYQPGPEVLGLDPGEFCDLSVDVHVNPRGAHTEVKVEACGTVRLVCDRTLNEFCQHVKGSCCVVYAPAVRDLKREDRDRFDEWYMSDKGNAVVDLAPVIRDSFLLARPLRAVSPEGAGVEMPIVFQDAPAGTDERWAVLSALKNSP